MMMLAPIASVFCAAASLPAADDIAVGYADTALDLIAEFPGATSANTLETSAGRSKSGGAEMDAIFQHPLQDGDATLTYVATLPPTREGGRLLLAFALGLRDGVRFDRPDVRVDGVLAAVSIEGRRLFEAAVHECRWREFAVDLTAFSGKRVSLQLTANANDTTNYDWLLWGRPRLYNVWRAEDDQRPARVYAGIALLASADGRSAVRRFALDRSTPPDEAVAALLGEEPSAPLTRAELFAFLPRLVFRSLSSGSHVLFGGKDYAVHVAVDNVGEAPVEDFHRAGIALSGAPLRRGRAERSLPSVGVGESVTHTWQMRGTPRRDSTTVTVALRSAVPFLLAEESRSLLLQFQRAMPALPPRAANELRSILQRDYALLENQHLRLAFVNSDGTYPYLTLFAHKGQNVQQVATAAPMSRLVYRADDGRPANLDLVPTDAHMAGSDDGDASLHFRAVQQDADGVAWTFEATFGLRDDSRRVLVDYALRANRPREVLHFGGPMLRVGDGSGGVQKEFALFPGLEFLEGDEPSSSTRDAAPPIANRIAPHPYKITIPAMAVQQGGTTVGLLWDPLFAWGEDRTGLSAVFAAPNRLDGEENHLLGVFLPTIPRWVRENHLVAEEGIVVHDEPVRLRAQVFADPAGSIVDVPDLWAEAYGMPKPEDAPRSDEEELLLSRHGFMVSTWDQETEKSRHCVGWAPANAPGFATLLWYDHLATNDASVRERVERIVRKTLEEQGPQGLASPANCHILRWELPFYVGHVAEGMAGARRQVEALIASQEADGSWRFHPTSDQTRTLGKEGDAVLGTCASKALPLLRFARITGDKKALAAGLRALEFMARFAVPRGAQAWECPLYEPDILAAAHAVGAYLEAHAITSDEQYVRRAEYWAKTGLPFLYYWNVPDRPGMRFASIPVFGTTFYTHSWFGVPVQWNGLVYAYYVQKLAPHSDYPWTQIAEGVTVSAMHQQWTEGELRGTYPDGFYGFCTEGRGPHINPEDIVANLLALRGHDPDISTAVAALPGEGRVHVSSGSRVGAMRVQDGALGFSLALVPDRDAHVLVAGLPGVRGVTVNGRELPRTASLPPGRIGWTWDQENMWALLCVPQKDETQVVVEWTEGTDADGP